MNNRKTIFCEMGFWDRFSKSTPMPLSIESETWNNTFRFLGNSDIHFDSTYAEVMKKASCDKYLKMIWKRSANGECDIIPEKDYPDLDSFTTDDAQTYHDAVFFTVKGNQICESLAKRYGIMAFNTSKMLSSDYLFKDTGEAIEKSSKSIKSWNHFHRQFGHPCNSLLIVDNFIAQRTAIIDKDLKELLDAILPKKLDVSFDLAIFCKKIEFGDELKNRYDRILNMLVGEHGIRKQLNIRLSLFITEEFHDRAAVSNHIWIESRSGFDGCGKSTTTVSVVYPLIQRYSPALNDSYLNVIRIAYKVRENSKKGWNFEGDEHNRLIDCGAPDK